MMKRITQKVLVTVILTLGITFNSYSAKKDSIIIKPTWNIGETLVYKVFDLDVHQNKNGYILGREFDSSYVFLNAFKKRGSTTLVKLNYRKSESLGDTSFVFPNLSKNFESILVFDSMGKVLNIINWKSIATKYLVALQAKLKNGQLDLNSYNYWAMYYSKESSMRDIILQDLNKLLYGYGDGYVEDNKYLIQRKLPNPFQGDALVVTGTSTLAKASRKSENTFVLENKSWTDDSHTLKLGQDFIKYKKKIKEPYESVSPQFSVGNEEKFRFNKAVGRITFCSIQDSLISELESRIVTTEYFLINSFMTD